LRKALGERNQLKAYTIADNFASKSKDNPMVVTTGLVFSFYPIVEIPFKDKNPKM
jgi:DNA polymerase-3 subunit delta